MGIIDDREADLLLGVDPLAQERADHDAQCQCVGVDQLRDVERALADARAFAAASMRLCELALARLADTRQHAGFDVMPTGHVSTQVRAAAKGHAACDSEMPDVRHENLPLTAREQEILQQIAVGRSNRQIAGTLFISDRTVERHIANVYLKINVHNKADATTYAWRHDLV